MQNELSRSTETRPAILALLALLEELHGARLGSNREALLQLWTLALEIVTDEQIISALPDITRMEVFGTPKPSDVLKVINERKGAAPGNARALSEWKKPTEPEGCDVRNAWGITEELLERRASD